MAIYIFGCRIYLDSDPTVANASDIGLYDDADNDANQVFRWIDTDISSYSPTYTWKSGVLKPSPFDEISESVDLSYGGNIPSVGGNSIKVTGTINYGGSFTQLDKILNDNSLRLNGLRCDIVRFEVSSGSLVAADGAIVFRGICGDIKWVEKVLTIPVENALLKRKANLATTVNTTDYPDASPDIIGKTIPVTFGEFKPEFDANDNPVWNGYAKFVRVANKEEVLGIDTEVYTVFGNKYFFVDDPITDTPLKFFPIVGDDGDTPPIMYKIKIANAGEWRLGLFPPPLSGTIDLTASFVGKYIQVIEGAGNGQYRKIATAQVDIDTDATIIEFTVYDYFETTLVGNATATEASNSWIKIITIARQYQSDVWPCKNYLDENGNVITQGLNLYSYAQESTAKVKDVNVDAVVEETPIQFFRLPEYAYEDSASGNNNEITVDVKLFNDSPDQMNSFIIKPIENFKLNDSADLGEWAHLAGQNWDLWKKRENGLYVKTGDISEPTSNTHLDTQYERIDYVTDKKDNTHSEVFITATNGLLAAEAAHTISFVFDIPQIPKSLNFDSVHLIIKYESNTGVYNIIDSDLYVRYKRFMGNATNILSQTNALAYWDEGSEGGELKSDPDFYYSPAPDTKNKYFYVNNIVSAPERNIWSYLKLEFGGITNEDLYNSIQKVGIHAYHEYTVGTSNLAFVGIKIYELAVAFKKSVSIKDAIYSPFQSRIYDDLWGGRKTATAMINNPIDVYEHVMRLQNWSEQGETKNWGKEYPNVPLIDVSTTEGGFDYEDLNAIKDIKIARQTLEKKDAETTSLAKSICKNFFCAGYQNPTTGEESLAYITGKSLSTPATTITLSDILGEIGTVEFPRMKGIFTEPFVKYAKNNATGEFEKTIKLTNTDEAAYSSDYVIGLSGTAAEFLWTKAHVLREAYRQVETPSSDMTNLDWVYDSSGAEWYLDNWLSWMGGISTDGTVGGIEFEPKKRISFTVPYFIGKDWFLTKHINLQLPHQTNDTAIECIIEKLGKNISQGSESVTVQVILYGAASEIALYVQDTVDAGGLLDDWQDSYETKAEEPTQSEDVQDMT